MGINKIEFDSTVLIDLTDDTIVADKLYSGYTAHDRSGTLITGTLESVPLIPIHYDYNIGYISGNQWVYENPTQTYIDIYEVVSDHIYFITLGGNVGSRFRSMFTTTDVTTVTSGRVTGTQIINTNNPKAYANATFTTTEDGYILVAKDNVGKSGLFTYVYDKSKGWL